MRRLLTLMVLATSAFGQIATTGTPCSGVSSCTPTAAIGTLELALAGRNASAVAPTNTGWTSLGTASINGTGSADSSVNLMCKVPTTTNEASGTFTNADAVSIVLFSGNTLGITTATCAQAFGTVGAGNFFKSTVNTTTVTETFNTVTNGNASSWNAGLGYCSACTAGIGTAPAAMTNRTSGGTGPPSMGGHDTNATTSQYNTANVTLTTAGRIITAVVEILAPVLAVPTFTDGTGTYNNDLSETITCGNSATACYTTDGSTPAATTPGTCSTGTAYTVPIAITATGTTLKAICTKLAWTNSTVTTATYTLTVGAVSSAPGAGTYGSAQSVTLSVATTTGASIFYTLDNTAPTCASTLYSGAINVAVTTHVRFLGCKTNYNSSAAVDDLYTITVASSCVQSRTLLGVGCK